VEPAGVGRGAVGASDATAFSSAEVQAQSAAPVGGGCGRGAAGAVEKGDLARR
jgi:hypothetical protein